MTQFLRYIIRIIANPVSGFRIVLKHKPFVILSSMVIVLGVAGSTMVYFSPSTPFLNREDRIIVLLLPIIVLSSWLLLSLLLYLGGRRLGGKATFKDMILVTGMAITIMIMFGFISRILFMLAGLAHVKALSHIAVFTDYIFTLWFWVLIIIGSREAQRLSTGRAIGGMIIAALYAFAVIVLFLLTSYLLLRI